MLTNVLGVGIDLCSVSEIKSLGERTSFVSHTFSEEEVLEAERSSDKWTFLSDNFAVKEATFKAISHLTPEKYFDFRIVETFRNPDGSPEIRIVPKLKEIMNKANVNRFLVSITNQGDLSMAEVLAVEDIKI